MFKKRFSLLFFVVLLIGCSSEEVSQSQETVANLEKDLAKSNEQLVEKENELKALYQQIDEIKQQVQSEDTTDLESIKNSEGEVSLSSNAVIQRWQLVNQKFGGTTIWRKWEREFDQSLLEPNKMWETPETLLTAWKKDVEKRYWLGQEGEEVVKTDTIIGFTDDGKVLGYITRYGFRDDSIGGEDIKLIMKQENGFWYIESVKIRNQCYRGSSENKGKEFCL
jgi:hypothetical protein